MEPSQGVQTVWLDVSLLMKHCDPRQPTGIVRTTAQIFQSLWARGYTNLRLCQSALPRGGMTETRPSELLARFTGPEPSGPPIKVMDGKNSCFGRVRRLLRRALSTRNDSTLPLVEFGPTDLLVHLGGAWAEPGAAALFAHLHYRQRLRITHLIYDLIPVLQPQFFPEGLAPTFDDYFRLTLQTAEFLMSISEQTRADLALYAKQNALPLPPVEVVRLGETLPGHETNAIPPMELSAGSDRPFVLCVGTQEVRKNHYLLYQVWRRLVEKHGKQTPLLVIAGAPGWLNGDIAYQIRTDPLTRGQIITVSSANDRQLRWLYRRCLFTVYPSHYEGWGLPIAEALGYGKLCIVSNTSSMPEIAADLTPMADPCDAPAWLALIENALDADYRAVQEERIRRLFRPTSWDDTTNQTVGYIDRHFGAVFRSPSRPVAA